MGRDRQGPGAPVYPVHTLRVNLRTQLRYASRMDIQKMLAEMRQELAAIEEAILVLERLASGRGRRRGRPPAWMKAAAAITPERRGGPPGSKNKPQSEGVENGR